MSKIQAEAEYIAKHEALGRKELLHLCRMGGITAHGIKGDYELARLLWRAFGRQAYERDMKISA